MVQLVHLVESDAACVCVLWFIDPVIDCCVLSARFKDTGTLWLDAASKHCKGMTTIIKQKKALATFGNLFN